MKKDREGRTIYSDISGYHFAKQDSPCNICRSVDHWAETCVLLPLFYAMKAKRQAAGEVSWDEPGMPQEQGINNTPNP